MKQRSSAEVLPQVSGSTLEYLENVRTAHDVETLLVEWHFTPDGKAWHIALQLLATALQCPVGRALFGESTAFLSTTITFKELF